MRLIFAVFTLFSHLSLGAQDCKIENGYAYQRTTIPGNIPRRDLDESGKEIDKPVKFMNTMFIYVDTAKSFSLRVVKLWIVGKPYRVRLNEIRELPVIIQHSHPGTPPDTLVRPTKRRVFRLQPVAEWNEGEKKNEVQQNERTIVIEYTYKRRTTLYKIPEVKRIAPMVLQ